MLSNIASYLGYPVMSPVETQTPTVDVRLRAVDEDDDWVLVEKNDSCIDSTNVTSEDEAGVTRVTLAISTCPSSTSRGLTPSSSLDIPCALQESWYLTPPPSFTSDRPVHMETSPLENLLIEHPSMSVYQHSQTSKTTRRKTSTSTPPSSPTSEEDTPTLRPSSEERTLPPRPIKKEKLNKLPRNKLNTKFSKKVFTKRSQTSSSDDAISLQSDDESKVVKELKMKSFVKSPRKSLTQEFKSFSRKSLLRRPETSSSDEMISIPSTNEDDSIMTSEPEQMAENKISAPPRKLYSEVLGTKVESLSSPKTTIQEVKEAITEVAAEGPVVSEESPDNAMALSSIGNQNVDEDCESVMAVEENVAVVQSEMERDRRRAVQTITDQQQRQHLLNRSAQKTEQRKTYDFMKRNSLGRNNKAREINSRNKRQRRADMMQRHSGANNNRKSC